MKSIICIMVLLCLYSSIKSQEIKPLTISQQLSNVNFNSVINYTKNTATLNQLKKKITLIDFWSTRCAACLTQIPEWDSLQKKYPEEFAVILVNSASGETAAKVAKALQRIQITTGRTINIPVVLGDTILKKIFPHVYVPHYVLLDEDGKFIAAKEYDELSLESMVALIQNGQPSFLEKSEPIKFQNTAPLFVNGNGGNGEDIMYRSTFTQYINGIPPRRHTIKDSLGNITKLLFTNLALSELMKIAYGYEPSMSSLRWPANNDTMAAKKFTYELITPPLSAEQANKQMQQDIKNCLGYKATIKDAPITYYELVVDSLITKQHTTNGTKYLLGEIISLLSKRLNATIINDASYPGNFYVNLSYASFTDLSTLKKVLLAAGIRLQEKQKIGPSLFIYHSSN